MLKPEGMGLVTASRLLLMVLVAIPAVTGTASATPLFHAAMNLAVTRPRSVAIADLDHDSNPDLAVASYTTGNVSVLLGNGDGTFQTAVHYVVGTSPYSAATGDLDGDGNTDIAVANEGSGNVTVLLGNGDGTFAAAADYAAGTSPSWLVIGDLSDDGIADLAVTNYGSNTVSVFLGNGDGTFQTAVDFGTGTRPTCVAAGDMNGDGSPDLTVNNYGNNVSVLLGNGDGSFQSAVNSGTVWIPNVLALGDLDGDGNLDVAVATSNDPYSLSILRGNGDGTLQAAVNYNTSGRWARSVTLEDLDGDEDLDLVLGNTLGVSMFTPGGNVAVLYNNGQGSFWDSAHYTGDFSPEFVCAGDLNRDGEPELAFTNAGSVTILPGIGNGRHQMTPFTGVGGLYTVLTSVSTGDADGDGHADMLRATEFDYTAGYINILLGGGDGTFPRASSCFVGMNPRPPAIGDINEDGHPDLATFSAERSMLFVGNGDGTFRELSRETRSDSAGLLEDFNADGHLDLARAYGGGKVSIRLGNGDGTFQTEMEYAAGPFPERMAIGDFNGDSFADLAVADWGGSDGSPPGDVSILLGNGDGTFQPAGSYAAAYGSDIATGDVNEDGLSDLAVAGGGSVGLLLGSIDGTLRTGETYAGVGTPVSVGDFNGDGHLDLALTRNGLFILLGNGDGTFVETSISYTIGGYSVGSVTADFDEDGHLDIVVGDGSSNRIFLLLNRGIGNPLCKDQDSDGYGLLATPLCPHPEADCNDDPAGDPAGCQSCACGDAACALCARCIHPGAIEVCDGADNNCDGQQDEEPAASAGCQNQDLCDGQEACGSGACRPGTPLNCEDGNACTSDSCRPASGCAHDCAAAGHEDACCTDPACSGNPVCQGPPCVDTDGDGYGNPASVTCAYPELDCNDADQTVNPGMTEVPGNGKDDDCNPATPPYGTPASVLHTDHERPSGVANSVLLLLPFGALFILRKLTGKA